MPVNREQAIEELKRRGYDTSKYETLPMASPSTSKMTPKQTAYSLLKERGWNDEDITKAIEKRTPKPLSFWKSLTEEIPEYGGAITGGIAGAKAGGAIGGIIGAGLGGAAGVAYQQLGKRAFGDPDVPETALEAGKEIGLAGGRQAAYETGGRLLIGSIGKVLAPFKKGIMPEAKIAQETLDKYMPKETSRLRILSRLKGEKIPSLLPAEATENRTLDLLNNVAEASLIGGKKIADYKNIIRPQAMSDMVDDLVRMFGEKAEPDMVGEAFTLAIEKGLKPSRMAATTLYNTVDDMTKGITASTQSLKKFAQPLAERAKEIGSIEAKNAGDDLVQAIMDLPDNISYGAMKELRSRLISRIDEFSIINKKAPAIGKAKQFISLSDNAIETMLTKENPEALQIWRQANKLYREGSEQFDNEFIRRLVKLGVDKETPEVIAKGIFKPGAVSNIRKAKNAVDETTWKQLKSWYIQDIIKKSVDTSGEISGKAFFNQLTGKAGMGEQALKEIFKPDELFALKNVATTLKVIGERQGEGTGKIFIQLTQAGAIMGIATGTARPVATVILGAPIVLARLFTNPIAVKWLTQGAKLPASSPQLGALLTRIGGLAFEIEQDMKRKGEIKPSMAEIQQLKGTSTIKSQSQPIFDYNPDTGEFNEAAE